ncbi:MAG: patatin-like phospholipase family protein [Nitrospirae bacterium]|nr:patatin-like phospholipase family protein [Nitrospirota bacterium]
MTSYIAGNKFQNLWKEEWERYLKNRTPHRRNLRDPDSGNDPTTKINLVGIAFSGGGIRSATFNLGLLQALARLRFLKHCDYLSTVSGGGYIGSCLTSHLHRPLEGEKPVKMEGDQFPFALPLDGKERPEVRHLRNHGNYLAPRHGLFRLDTWRLISTYVTGLLVLLPVPLALFIVIAGSIDALSLIVDRLWVILSFPAIFLVVLLAVTGKWNRPDKKSSSVLHHPKTLPILLLTLLGTMLFTFWTQPQGVFWLTPAIWYWTPSNCLTAGTDSFRRCLGFLAWVPSGLIRLLVAWVLALIVLFILSVAVFLVKMKEQSRPERRELLAKIQSRTLLFLFVTILLAILPTSVLAWSSLWRWVAEKASEGWGEIGKWTVSFLSLLATLMANRAWQNKWIKKLKTPLVKGGVIVFLISISLSLISLYRDHPIPLFWTSAGILILAVLFLDPDRASLHFLYRDRLTEAYVVRPKSTNPESFVPNHDLRLHSLCQEASPSEDFRPPYHLINATINLCGDGNIDSRGRNADLFQFSPFYCGSKSTGWRASTMYESGRMDLATAMAISGAAVGSQMGMYTSRPMAILMTLLNIRLGSWRQNPRATEWWKGGILGTLFFELLSLDSLNSPYVNLSDGGHFENLGLYALVQRRCKYILVSDAGADEGSAFADLANALRKIRIDFGVQVHLNPLVLMPDSRTGLSRQHCAVGKIEYPEGEEGILVYLKPTLCEDSPADLLAYRQVDETFPHQTTLDQFFDEAQFESYRALGYHIGKEVFAEDENILKEQDMDVAEKVFTRLLFRWIKPVPG